MTDLPTARSALWKVGGALVVLGAVVLGASPVLTPGPTADISVERATAAVEFMATGPRPLGTPEIARVRDYLVSTLAEMGLSPVTQTVAVPNYFASTGTTADVTNVMARIDGTAGAEQAVLLLAHYDTVPSTPGANDNAAAVAALLEAGRALVDDPPTRDVILLFTDGEEPTPRFGATAFTDHPWFDDVVLAANFEGIGGAGPSLLVELNDPSGSAAGRLATAVRHPAMFSFLTRTAQLIGGATSDFDVLEERGIPGYNFAYLRGSSIYHTERDDPTSLNVGGMAHHASLALDVARHALPLDLDQSAGAKVFFTIPGRMVVRYGGSLAAASAVLAAVALALAPIRRIRRRTSSLRRIAAGTGLALAGSFAAVLVPTVVWIGIVAIREDMGMVEAYGWLAILLVCLAGIVILVGRRSGRTGSDVASGVALVWGTLALVTGFWLRPMSYLFVWPALAAGLAGATRRRVDRSWKRLAVLGAVALPAAVVLVPAVDTLFMLATPRPGNPGSGLPAAVAVPLLLVVLAVGLVNSTLAETGRVAPHPPLN